MECLIYVRHYVHSRHSKSIFGREKRKGEKNLHTHTHTQSQSSVVSMNKKLAVNYEHNILFNMDTDFIYIYRIRVM